jgi:RiboL-PSP-HEPN
MQCAATVILSGYFESFLGDIAEAFVTELCSKAIPFNSLPLRIRATHFGNGAEFLAKMSRREAALIKRDPSLHRLIDSEAIVQRMASVVSGTAYELIWEAFAEARTNPGPDTLREFLARFDIKESWKSLAAKTGLSETTIDASLTSFRAIRNECAHTGTATEIPAPSDIRGYCDLLQKVASGIAGILEGHLDGLTVLAPHQ